MKKHLKKVYKGTFENFKKTIERNIIKNKKMFIVTANPETIMFTNKNREFNEALTKSTIVADGIGVVKACKKLDMKVNKITGVDIATYLLEISDEKKLKIVLLGATKEVNDSLVKKLKEEKPNINIISNIDGYDESKEEKLKLALKLKPDIIMIALGIPRQELLINKYFDTAKKGIFIGVGGSFDVLSGTKKRAPKFFLKTNTEWLYRIVKEPSRLKRFYDNNIKFLFMIKK